MRAHDVGAGLMQSRLRAMETQRNRSSRDPGEPFQERTREEIDRLLGKVDKTGDLTGLNTVDNFRQTLTPELQAEYDRQLEELRNDPRIEFEYREGAKPSAAEEDLALRGILASTFGNPQLLDSTLENSLGEDGRVAIYVYPSSFPLSDFGSTSTTNAPGYATPDGGIAIAQDFNRDVLAQGDNPFVHEFGHLTDRSNGDVNYPEDFPFAESTQAELESEHFQEFLIDRFNGGNPPLDEDGNPKPLHTGGEGWPTMLNLFKQYPEELKEASPDIYRNMTEYFGYDPLTQESGPPVQLNGTGGLDQALSPLTENFERIAGENGRISEDELRAALVDPSYDQVTHAAIAHLLSSRAAYSAVDVGAGRGEVDGDISLNDLTGAEEARSAAGGYSGATDGVEGAVDTREEAERVLERYLALADTAAGRGESDGHVSDNDLEALASDPGATPELRAAARYLLQN
jgi:hypothetical protein